MRNDRNNPSLAPNNTRYYDECCLFVRSNRVTMKKILFFTVPTAQQTEARAIYFAGSAFVISFLVALLLFWPNSIALFSGKSIGLVATLSATIAVLVGFYMGNVGQNSYKRTMK